MGFDETPLVYGSYQLPPDDEGRKGGLI
jgi:hypothetical protein